MKYVDKGDQNYTPGAEMVRVSVLLVAVMGLTGCVSQKSEPKSEKQQLLDRVATAVAKIERVQSSLYTEVSADTAYEFLWPERDKLAAEGVRLAEHLKEKFDSLDTEWQELARMRVKDLELGAERWLNSLEMAKSIFQIQRAAQDRIE